MIELKPVTLIALGLGVACVVLASAVPMDVTAQATLTTAGGWLIGLVMRGPGLVTQTQAKREVERASVAPPPVPAGSPIDVQDPDKE